MNWSEFAADWEAGWNSHDLNRIMKHYRDDIEFRSRKALDLVGQGELKGVKELRAYWAAALERQPDLRFKVQSVMAGHDMGAWVYTNHRNVLASEVLYVDDDNKVYRAAACHQVAQ